MWLITLRENKITISFVADKFVRIERSIEGGSKGSLLKIKFFKSSLKIPKKQVVQEKKEFKIQTA